MLTLGSLSQAEPPLVLTSKAVLSLYINLARSILRKVCLPRPSKAPANRLVLGAPLRLGSPLLLFLLGLRVLGVFALLSETKQCFSPPSQLCAYLTSLTKPSVRNARLLGAPPGARLFPTLLLETSSRSIQRTGDL